MTKLSLIQMREDQKAKVLDVSGSKGFQHKMMSMGIYPGVEITKVSHFALQGPVTIRVGRGTVALGHGIAARISVETE
jgi:Fe2+ transport system protein FeoA